MCAYVCFCLISQHPSLCALLVELKFGTICTIQHRISFSRTQLPASKKTRTKQSVLAFTEPH